MSECSLPLRNVKKKNCKTMMGLTTTNPRAPDMLKMKQRDVSRNPYTYLPQTINSCWYLGTNFMYTRHSNTASAKRTCAEYNGTSILTKQESDHLRPELSVRREGRRGTQHGDTRLLRHKFVSVSLQAQYCCKKSKTPSSTRTRGL